MIGAFSAKWYNRDRGLQVLLTLLCGLGSGWSLVGSRSAVGGATSLGRFLIDLALSFPSASFGANVYADNEQSLINL